jgi:hypothetical protein
MIDTQTLGTGILALYAGSSGASLRALTGNGKLFQSQAPQSTVFPYIVFHLIDDVNDDTFTEEVSVCRVQFSIFTKISAANNTGSIQRALKVLYHQISLTLSGYTHIATQYLSARDLGIDDQGISHTAMDFYIYVQKA